MIGRFAGWKIVLTLTRDIIMHNKARSSTYIIKEIEKLVLCVYGMI